MVDVFVSYARPDEPQAAQVADALRAKGYHVWRDDELPAHRAYAEVIQERLNESGAVVVLWSAEAARSHWVRAEADAARSASATCAACGSSGRAYETKTSTIHSPSTRQISGIRR